ncbi:MAG: glutathione S-transferase family protein [Alphaproteobacteria bacterium]|nr:glutathione S-transferase family protein [Alphaproteobacteria bacterium]
MSLHLYYHPLSSFCWKAEIALYENGTAFVPHIVNLMDEGERNAFYEMWPIGKFPVLRDDRDDRIIPESSIIIEYLDQHYPGATKFIPSDPDAARQMRMRDRFYDLYLQLPMQKITADKMRPEGMHDPMGVADARRAIETAYRMVEEDLAGKTWAMGDAFTMADCAALPALYYADFRVPMEGRFPNAQKYLERLKARPSIARTLKEAEPYLHMVPR